MPQQERRLLEALLPQLRELITDDDQLTWRLFPNPYPDDSDAADDYASMIGDDLRDHHLESLDVVEATLDAKRLEEDQLEAWMHAVNDLRLVIGSRLDVEEDTEVDDFDDDVEQSLYVTYLYLGSMLERIVRAVAGE